MPILPNPRHERFAQELAMGRTSEEAYATAGFKPDRGNASRLTANDSVRARVAEIQGRGAERAEITVEMVLRELAKIGFSDIRNVVTWGEAIAVKNAETGETKVTNGVALVASGDLAADAAACIAEVSQTKDGALKVKLHDKRAALVDIGKHLGMFKDRVEVTGRDGSPLQMLYQQIQGTAFRPRDPVLDEGKSRVPASRPPPL